MPYVVNRRFSNTYNDESEVIRLGISIAIIIPKINLLTEPFQLNKKTSQRKQNLLKTFFF